MFTRINGYIQSLYVNIRVKDSFARNLAITFSGNAASQVVGFLFTPFIARIYGPDIYGIFALFIAIVNNLSPLSTFQFPSGYVAAENEKEFHILLKITFGILLTISFLSTLGVLLFGQAILEFFGEGNPGVYAYFFPLYIFFMGLDNLLSGWCIRIKQFQRSAFAKVVSVFTSKGITLAIGIFSSTTPFGMILGNLINYPADTLFKTTRAMRTSFLKIFEQGSFSEVKSVWKKFKAYPLFITPGIIISNLSAQLPVYIFSLNFSQTSVGLFALANGIIAIPLSIITNSSTTVFLQKAAETQQKNLTHLKGLVRSLNQKMFLFGAISFCSFALISPTIFEIVLGETWREAGVIASFLVVSAILNVPVIPLSVLFRLMGFERVNFVINVSTVFIRLAGLAVGVYFKDITLSVIGYCLATIISSMISQMFIFRIVNLSLWLLVKYFLSVLLFFGFLVWLRY